MNPQTVLVFTWILVLLVVGGYIWFIVWRVRVDRRKKAAAADADAPLRAALANLGTPPASEPVTNAAIAPAGAPAASAAEVASDAPSPAASSTSTEPANAPIPAAGAPATVIEALSGIQLPYDLVPLTTMAARPEVGDRIAFWTDRAPAEVVGPAFADELERLGYEVAPLDLHTLGAQRGHGRLLVALHPDAHTAKLGTERLFPSVPEISVVVEVWLAP